MTKKIVWRLKEQPTAEMLRDLVASGILNKEEAREILFNLQEETERDNESLKQEIKFLRELVEKLASIQKVVEIIREIEKPYCPKPWYNPYKYWCANDNILLCTNGNDTADNTSFTSFSSIKTF
jgi:polyhydroxyalkanoate synthesis regulator phasin